MGYILIKIDIGDKYTWWEWATKAKEELAKEILEKEVKLEKIKEMKIVHDELGEDSYTLEVLP